MSLNNDEIIELEKLLIIQRSFILKHSLFEFVKEFWSVLNTSSYCHNWHIEYLCDELQLVLDKWVLNRNPHIANDKWYYGICESIPKNLIINISPGTTKSTIVSRMAPAWLWANDDSKTIISSTIDSKNATEFSTSTKDLIQSELFKRYFSNVNIRRDVSAKTFYQSEKGGKRYSLTTRGSKTGKHADLIIDDDAMDYESANSPMEAKQCIEGFKALQTRKKDKERVPYILVMQRLSTKDTTAHALKVLTDLRHICLPAENIYDNIKPAELKNFYVDNLLDVNRLNRKVLESQKKGLSDDTKPMSDIAFNIQFNQVSISEESLLYGTLNKVDELPFINGQSIKMTFTDVADKGEDYLCTWFLQIIEKKIYIYDAIYTQESSDITIPRLEVSLKANNAPINRIETNNQGSVFVSVLQGKGVNVNGYNNSGNKIERITAYAHFISLLYFVKPKESQIEYRKALSHLESFPKNCKSEDGHDDAEDALTEAIRYLYTNFRYLFT